MGHDELPYLLFGAQSATDGTISLARQDRVAARDLNPKAAMKLGLALLPADRHAPQDPRRARPEPEPRVP